MNRNFWAGVAKSVPHHMQIRIGLAGLVAHGQPRPPTWGLTIQCKMFPQ